jgi:ankyrin repeat protein
MLFELLKEMKEAGADLNAQCDQGNTPLHYCMLSDSVKIAGWLLLQKVDPNLQVGIFFILGVLGSIGSIGSIGSVGSVGRVGECWECWESQYSLDFLEMLGFSLSLLSFQNKEGKSPLHLLLTHDLDKSVPDSSTLLEHLTSNGANWSTPNSHAVTPHQIVLQNPERLSSYFKFIPSSVRTPLQVSPPWSPKSENPKPKTLNPKTLKP